MKIKLLFLAVITVILVESLFLFGGFTHKDRPKDPLKELWAGNFSSEREYWKEKIEEVGTKEAYELFKADTQGKSFGVSHTLAHIFGELIYEREGIEGVAFCDSTFAFGCYHSFFGKAITENGVGVVQDLDKACIKKWGEKGLGCPHGIGHGVMGYLGDAKLDEALEICGTLNWKEPIGGCSSGVFMEYNFHTMQSLEGAENREFDPKDPHHPCNSVPERYRQACYFEQPQWWSQIFAKDYVKVGSLCREVSKEAERQACFRGLGNTVGPDSMYDAKKTIASCMSISGGEAQLLCREGASWAFYAEPSARDRAKEICDDLPQDTFRRCMSGFDLAGDRI